MSLKHATNGLFVVLVNAWVLSSIAHGQTDRFADVVIEPTEVARGAYMMTGAGGNIAVSVGDDGVLIVDDQFAPLATRIAEALVPLAGDTINPAVRYVINTHYHGDHTGSNAFFGGAGATIIAHDNVRVRLLSNETTQKAALPVVTHTEGVSVYFNDEHFTLIPLSGHTDGDSAVLFHRANVLHTGDLLFNGRFPYIDLEGGGGVSAYLTSQGKLLDVVNDNTIIIPGHGPLASVADLRAMQTMISVTAQAVREAVANGDSLETIVERGVDPAYASMAWSFISEARWLEILYWDAMTNH